MMLNDTRKSGLTLALASFVAICFFYFTDPGWGLADQRNTAIIDAINIARPGTYLGLVGSAIMLISGLFLMTRRTA